MMMAWRAWRAPYNSADHFATVKDVCAANFQTMDHTEDVMFQDVILGMLHDRHEDHRAGEPGIELLMHSELKSADALKYVRADSTTTRFCDFIERSEKEDAD